MEDREPTIRSRELGEGLRQVMEHAGLNGNEAARLLGWSQSTVSRLLSGKRGGSEVHVATFLGLCRVKGPERDRLLALCPEVNTPGWLQQCDSRQHKGPRTLVNHENLAVTISDFQPVFVPGLLQTGDYARAVISRNVNVSPEEVEELMAARLARQRLLYRERPPHCYFYVHESALRLPVGGAKVMAEQLCHLLRVSMRPHVTVQVVPISLGAHAAMTGAFKLMEFAEFKPVVYHEGETFELFLEKRDEIFAYERVLAALAQAALGEEESRELMASLATEFSANREDHDDPA